MKFIGHLDMMRYFQKAMRRAEIDIKYSEGFSPHQIMSFAAPLGVGITSDGEYLDIEVNSTKSSKESLDALNATMVNGVEVTSYVALPETAKNAMSIVSSARYQLFWKDGYECPTDYKNFEKLIDESFQQASEFVIMKKTKKSERAVDLKQHVSDFYVEEVNGKPCFTIQLSTGSENNIKPELLLQSFFEKNGLAYIPEAIQIHREEVFTTDEFGNYVPLEALGDEIA